MTSLPERTQQAELILKKMGLRQLRVRHHEQLARIEVEPEHFPTVVNQRETIVTAFEKLGYTYVTLDLVGFRSGSMNEGTQLVSLSIEPQ